MHPPNPYPYNTTFYWHDELLYWRKSLAEWRSMCGSPVGSVRGRALRMVKHARANYFESAHRLHEALYRTKRTSTPPKTKG